jgi:hypothetical protein
MAGTFTPTDKNTALICDTAADLGIWTKEQTSSTACPASTPLAYIEHTLAGYNATQPNPGTYSFDWTPPASDVGSITIYVAANAANGDLQSTGDHIYTATYTLSSGGSAPPPDTVTVTPSSLTFDYNKTTNSSVSGLSQTVKLTSNTGLSFSASVTNGSSWISVLPPAGNTPATLTVTVDPSQLQAAATAYQGAITISYGNSTTVLNVAFQVSASQPVTTNTQTISHVADGAGWKTTVILVNTDSVAATFTLSFWKDNGSAMTLSLTGLGKLATVTGTIPVNGSKTIQSDGTAASLSTGWAQVSSAQSISGTAIFRSQSTGQEASVPLLAAGSNNLMFPFDNNKGLATGVALAAPGASQAVSASLVLDNQQGQTISTEPQETIQANGHMSFVLPVRSTLPQNMRGVADFGSAAAPIFGLGIRSNNAAFTSVDAVTAQPPSTKTISHIADGGSWKTTIILVNTDTSPANFTVNFWKEDGSAFSLPLVGFGQLASVSGTIPVGGSQTIETMGQAKQVTVGWAEVVSSQAVGGTAIFGSNGQEAAVGLLSSGRGTLVIPFDNSPGLALGIAIVNPDPNQDATIEVTLRNESGAVISHEPAITVAHHSHTSFVLPVRSTKAADVRGTVEFDSPNANIFALGIRSNGAAFTSIRALNK